MARAMSNGPRILVCVTGVSHMDKRDDPSMQLKM
ncbi:uncharacterized protein G2W53_010801 [Senna tora]|uniref:Uncharacterized protein n=1 Tax=Senna tora TaxID=362788 RepID=A0A834X0B7_9FABA|nr:uncharacterized protein G2W53_010801 [Senna tora]